jgi:hypothetical protein
MTVLEAWWRFAAIPLLSSWHGVLLDLGAPAMAPRPACPAGGAGARPDHPLPDIEGIEIPHGGSLVCAIVWVAAQEGLAAPHQIQNDSGLTQGFAARSAAGRTSSKLAIRLFLGGYSAAPFSNLCKSDCASAALSKICGATPRFSNASPSFMRKKPLVVYRDTPE